MTIATKYEYPLNRQYNETVAILADGRRLQVDTQYCQVRAHRGYTLDGVDVDALIVEARELGLFGVAPKVEPTDAELAQSEIESAEYEAHQAAMQRAMAE